MRMRSGRILQDPFARAYRHGLPRLAARQGQEQGEHGPRAAPGRSCASLHSGNSSFEVGIRAGATIGCGSSMVEPSSDARSRQRRDDLRHRRQQPESRPPHQHRDHLRPGLGQMGCCLCPRHAYPPLRSLRGHRRRWQGVGSPARGAPRRIRRSARASASQARAVSRTSPRSRTRAASHVSRRRAASPGGRGRTIKLYLRFLDICPDILRLSAGSWRGTPGSVTCDPPRRSSAHSPS